MYFSFKVLEFVIKAINLYEKILDRNEVIIQLLLDIRDNTRNVHSDVWNDNEVVVPIESTKYESFEDVFENQQLRDRIFYELKNKMNTNKEIEELGNMLRLSYNEFEGMKNKLDSISEKDKNIYNLIVEQMKQYTT